MYLIILDIIKKAKSRVKEKDKQIILVQLSFLDISKRTLLKYIREIGELMFSYQLGIFELNTLSTDIGVFDYLTFVLEKHVLDFKYTYYQLDK